ncbi:hydantoinase B/oxoprolinase family protein [Siccirubricoccus phaeus]|uniref:hydantoinase B/oxoprolinase family protein n=1 Tax=Siccirubricoccus phaeus TaxID=2595053 RepID=UPI0011F3AE99|nr:hydantoinase B/oxoprolinase family protein [Siccirubricoccus phaeus]
MSLDPVQLAVIQNGLRQVASEMDMVHQKTSFSPVISEGLDRANGIYHRETGEVIAQGETGLPSFIGVMQFSTQHIIRLRRDLEEGDVILVNDPYLGGTHLMDVRMLAPFHYRGKLWCHLSNTGHWSDTGGMVPGGFNSTATEIQQEGLRIPPVKLYRRGVLDEDIQQMVLNNVRVPEERLGDLRAQLGALRVGARRLTELLDRYGADVVEAAIEELKTRSERLMRAHIATIPDGTYEGTAFCDSDGVVFEKLAVRLRMNVKGDRIGFDLSQSSPPCKGPMNTPRDLATSAVYVAMKHVFPDVPINAGCFTPIEVGGQDGTFLDAQYPRPCAGAAAEVCQRVMESVFAAMGQAMPERMFASPFGTSGNFSLGGYDPEEDRRYIMYMFSGGGYGGYSEGDGLTNGCSSLSIAKTQPIEVLEQHFPVLYEEYALREGSAGAGRHRGGFGLNYRVKLLRGEARASFVMDHGVTGPAGLLGGGPGETLAIEVGQGGARSLPPHVSKGEGYALEPGDWVQVRTPGGGGYGPPAERDPAAIARDLRRGYLGPEQAAAEYGHKLAAE